MRQWLAAMQALERQANGRAIVPKDQCRLEMTDAANECVHGFLPIDSNISCRCWAVSSPNAS